MFRVLYVLQVEMMRRPQWIQNTMLSRAGPKETMSAKLCEGANKESIMNLSLVVSMPFLCRPPHVLEVVARPVTLFAYSDWPQPRNHILSPSEF
jgi:hypothetical protein